MRRAAKLQVVVLVVIVAACAVVLGACYASTTIDLVQIRNETDNRILVAIPRDTAACNHELGPHATQTVTIRRFERFLCEQFVAFYSNGRQIGRCTWDAAKLTEPVVVTEEGVSCDTSQ